MLDTWFSSGLLPFSTLGWPDADAPTSQRFYPNDVMMTGFDIIFFWVARMMMMGMRFMGDVPFRTVFLNGLVRDEKGEKMSKTKGNVVDPLDVIDKHGADALRFTLAALAAPGHRSRRWREARLLGYKAFVNKLWNASRFVLMNLEGERRAVRRPRGASAAQPLDPEPRCRTAARGRRGARGVPLRRGRRTRSTTSSGTSSATGTSRSSKAYLADPDAGARGARACCWRCWRRRCACCTRSCRS